MSPARRALVTLGVAVVVLGVWRRELYTVQNPGERPRPLAPISAAVREPVLLDVLLPRVPVGTERVASGELVTIVHYWAPWEQGATLQATAVDSLHRALESRDVRIVLVCSDPFPSVARYVARRRLQVSVLLDRAGTLKQRLPCPSIPYTYVIDRAGRIAVRQAGAIDWLAPETREVLWRLLAEPDGAPTEEPPAVPASSAAGGSVTRVRESA